MHRSPRTPAHRGTELNEGASHLMATTAPPDGVRHLVKAGRSAKLRRYQDPVATAAGLAARLLRQELAFTS
jgi:hypothetical protein